MTRKDYYAGTWDGICKRCGHDYFECRGNCTCLACAAQRQDEIQSGLWFDEDPEAERAEAGELLSSAAARLGRKGGRAGTGAAKRRGDAAYYQRLSAKGVRSRRRRRAEE